MADLPSFAEAIRDALRRKVQLPASFYGDVTGRARAAGFTVSGLASLDQVQRIADSLHDALAKGQSFGTWKKALLESGDDFGLPTGQLETIFRTNLQGWYAAGRAEQIQRNKGAFPYLRYSAIMDARTRPDHAALDGLILPVDHPLWKTHYPPWSFNCRCTVIPMTAAAAEAAIGEAREAGRSIDQPPANLAMPAEGWAYDRLNPAAPLEGLAGAVAKRASVCVPKQFAAKHRGPLLWCDGPGADALTRADTALRRDEPMPAPQRLDQSLDLPHGMPPEEYIAAFMAEFGAGAKGTVLYDSLPGIRLAVSRAIFEKKSGASKLTKRGRHLNVRYLAHGIKTPDEVWYVRDSGSTEALYYLSRMGATARTEGTLAVFRWNGSTWEPVTGYAADPAYVEEQREWLQTVGVLLYRR